LVQECKDLKGNLPGKTGMVWYRIVNVNREMLIVNIYAVSFGIARSWRPKLFMRNLLAMIILVRRMP